MSSIEDKEELIKSLTHISDDLDSTFMTYNKVKLGSNGASLAACALGITAVSLALAVPTAGASVIITSSVGVGLGASAAVVNAFCGIKQHLIIKNKINEVKKILLIYFNKNNIPFNIMPQPPSDSILLKEGAQATFVPVAKATKVAASAFAKGVLYTIDDAVDDIVGALPKITSGVSKVSGAALSYGFDVLGVTLCSIDTGLIISQMIEHSKNKELPSKQIRELILVLENSTLEEFSEENQLNKRTITVTVKNKAGIIAYFYVKYFLNGKPVDDLTRISGLKLGQTKKLTFFLPKNAQNPTLFIKSYRPWTHMILERKIDNFPYSGNFTLTGTSLREKFIETIE